ncbi:MULTISPECIES: MFS transporter [Methylosinus]|uniref:MFS transporter n=1 Tax=Methylosinus trichosporium (strain ATCC 35070 / NCIMB 11131 / UNIQEM 75 / OB3b) TaxID=595536 RepID=A0A2D2D5F6_METT3|nr:MULTISPECIES: MFS transporter [Methylosinus]ATQ70271.1 MFS transporter [Methylosinus trichosporium OB3b]OBS51779.1 MFS transporter [Methylosinus sp. 3S-1]
MRSERGLDVVNFLLADVQGGVGPFLAIYLWSSRHWDATQIGVVMTIAGVSTVLAKTPAGALVDRTSHKRGLVAAACLLVAVGASALALFPGFWPAAAAQAMVGACDAAFPPAIAAISLGVVGRALFAGRVGRNEVFNHLGNVVAAVLAGLAGWLIAPVAALWLVALFASVSALALRMIDPREIDDRVARGLDDGAGESKRRSPNGLRIILESRPLLIFTAAITLFHFANAAMLPLVGERLSVGEDQKGSMFMAACIVVAQIVMIPMAALAGAKAGTWGRKPLLLAAFAALPLRGALYTLTDDPAFLIAVQMLDGVGAGLFGALFFIVVADLTEGSGHYNLALGAVGATWGAGAALSNAVAGVVVDRAGFDAAFLFLAGIATLAFLLLWLAMPETLVATPTARRP